MIDTKTLTCSNCRGGDFIRLDDNEFKCTHCGSITIVQDDVAKRLEQILSKLQAPERAAPAAVAPAARVKAVLAAVLASLFVLAAFFAQIVHRTSSSGSAADRFHSRADVDPGLLKIETLHHVGENKMVGMVRNDSDRVVSYVSLGVHTFQGAIRSDDRSTSMDFRLLPGESQPIVFDFWPEKDGQRFEIADKQVRTEDDFNGRAPLQLTHEQLIRERTGTDSADLRFIGQLTNAQTAAAKSIEVSIQLFDHSGKLIGAGSRSPESSELAAGETTRFDVSLTIYESADIGSMQYVVDSERVKTGGDR